MKRRKGPEGGQEGTGWGGVERGPDGGRKGRNAREMKREGAGPVGALDWKMRCKGGRKGTEMRRGGINGRGWESGAGPQMCPGVPRLAGHPEGRNAGPSGRLARCVPGHIRLCSE